MPCHLIFFAYHQIGCKNLLNRDPNCGFAKIIPSPVVPYGAKVFFAHITRTEL